MKKYLLLTAFYLLLSLYPIPYTLYPVRASEPCPDNFYYPDSDLNACIYKHEGYLDPDDESADSDGCVYSFDRVDDSLCTEAGITPAPPETPPTSECGTSPETAVCNLNRGTLPKAVIQDIKPINKNIFENIISFFASILGFKPSFPEALTPRSEIQHQVGVPAEIKPDPKLNPIQQTGKNLGEETGLFSIGLPEEVKKDLKKTIDFGKAFERAHFPEGVNPITK